MANSGAKRITGKNKKSRKSQLKLNKRSKSNREVLNKLK